MIQLLLLDCRGNVKKSTGNIPEFTVDHLGDRHLYEYIPLLECILSHHMLPSSQSLLFPRVEVNFDIEESYFFNINIRRCKTFDPEVYVRCWIEDVTQNCLRLMQIQQTVQQRLIGQQTKL